MVGAGNVIVTVPLTYATNGTTVLTGIVVDITTADVNTGNTAITEPRSDDRASLTERRHPRLLRAPVPACSLVAGRHSRRRVINMRRLTFGVKASSVHSRQLLH